MKLGVDWYPEQHSPERWASDVARMAEAGLELVRLGEFAWTRMEPEPGRFDWGWLDRAIDAAADAGLGVILGTPTAVPPIWLCVQHPELLSVSAEGVRRAYGSRRFNCPTAPAYREASARIAEALARRYGGHQGIVAWQLDNEPGNHDSARCWCDLCETAFHGWLERRYGSIERLNRAWGAVFWSALYPSFETVRLPRPTNAHHSPSLLLAHRRFASHQAVECIREQRDIVAPLAPGREVFANFPPSENGLNVRDLARLGEVTAIDVYPTGMGTPEDLGYLLDLSRGHTGRGWIVEHQPGPINWTPTTDPVPPGQVRLWGWRAALHGFETFMFFSWWPTRSGSEQYHTGLLRHDGSEDRGLTEARQLAAELKAAGPTILTRPRAEVAVLVDHEDRWALEISPHRAGLTYYALVAAAHSAARRLGYEVDVVAPDGDLSGYRVVLAPALHFATDQRVQAVRGALGAGATVLLGARSLVKDADNCWLEEPLPAGLAEQLDSQVTDWFGLQDPGIRERECWGRWWGAAPAGMWADVLAEPPQGSDARVVARYQTGWLAGRPAAVRRGGLVYTGAPSTEAWEALLLAQIGVGPAGRGSATHERFFRAGRVIELDHQSLAISGLT